MKIPAPRSRLYIQGISFFIRPNSLQRSGTTKAGIVSVSTKSASPQPGPPKVPKIMAQYPKIESMGSIGSIIFGHFGGPGQRF